MYDKIDSNDVTVQIETAAEDNWVPDGIAVSSGIYDIPLVVDPASITPMGMTKTGSDVPLNDSWVDITGWAAMGDKPGTVIDSNKSLVVAETGTIMVSTAIKFNSTSYLTFNFIFANFRRSKGSVRLLRNDEVITTRTGENSVTLQKVVNVLAGDKIRIQVKGIKPENSGSFGTFPTLETTGTKIEFSGYDASSIDFEEGMAYAGDVGFYDDTWGRYVSPTHIKKGLPNATASSIRTNGELIDNGAGGYTLNHTSEMSLSRGSASGPILAQTRVPIAVFEGSKVNWSGIMRVRQTGSKDEQTDDGILTGLNVRFSLFGTGITTDEYGIESVTATELMFYQATLQSVSSEATSLIEYTLPTLPDATVPANVDSVYFTCSLVQVESEQYSAGTFTDKKTTQQSGGNQDRPTPPPKSTAEMKYFGWKHTNPLKINVSPPASMKRVTSHPMSKTGVAYKNGDVFTNVKANAKVTFFGMPNTATSINIHNYDGTTVGTLIGTYSALAGERKTVTITPSGTQIKISKSGANDYFIESVLNETTDTLTTLKTQIRSSTFSNVNDDISKISILREESDTGTLTIDFCSDNLDPFTSQVLLPGKVIRVLGRHYGSGVQVRPSGWTGEAEYVTLYTGVVKEVNTEYDYEESPIIQVIAYDVNDPLEKMKPGVAFDVMSKYIPFLNKVGQSVLLDSYDVGGKYGDMPDKFMHRPSSHGEYPLAQSLNMTRNTVRGYIYANRKNQLVILSEAKTNAPVVFTDGTGAGDLNYGRIGKKHATKTIINNIQLQENTLDAESFRETTIGGEDGPPSDIRYPEGKRRTATYRNADSILEWGEITRSLDVVRGDGDLKKLYRNDLGEGFTEWGAVLLDQNSSPVFTVQDVSVPVKGSDDIRKICAIDLLDPANVVYKGTTYTTKIREIEHTIIPGRWFSEYKFTTSGDMTIW